MLFEMINYHWLVVIEKSIVYDNNKFSCKYLSYL